MLLVFRIMSLHAQYLEDTKQHCHPLPLPMQPDRMHADSTPATRAHVLLARVLSLPTCAAVLPATLVWSVWGLAADRIVG
jgi:hypothetical protein